MKKVLNRWVYAITGVIVLLFAGIIYAWSVLSGPPVKEGLWTDSQLAWASTLVMLGFCIGSLLGGIIQKKHGIKILLFISAALFVAGFGIVSFTESVIVVYLGFGLLCGFASGFAYNAVMSSVSKWFLDKQGLISGILLMGFGIGSFLTGKIYTAIVGNGESWRTCFLWLGIICAVIVAIGGIILVKPTDEQAARYTVGLATKKAASYEEVPAKSVLKRSSFWLMFFWLVISSTAGLSVIFLGRPIAVEAVHSLADTPGIVATAVGLISVCNAASRIAFGGMFDKIGYKKTLIICSGMFIVTFGLIALALSTHSLVLVFVSYILTGLSFGGVTPSLSAFANKFYGINNYPINSSLLAMHLIIASFGPKLVDAVHIATNSYYVVLIGMAVLSAVAIVLALFIKKTC